MRNMFLREFNAGLSVEIKVCLDEHAISDLKLAAVLAED